MRALKEEPLPRVLSFPVPKEGDEQNYVYAIKDTRNDLNTVEKNIMLQFVMGKKTECSMY